MTELRDHPQIAELMETLEKNDMHKEKEKVESLVDYIGDMEQTLTEMLREMQDMRKEVSLIHNNSIRVKCQNLVQKTEDKIKQGLAVVVKIKDNLIQSAKNAVKTFKEKGKEAFHNAVIAMKIPETLDKLADLFGKFSRDIEQDIEKVKSMQTELSSAKGHLRNFGRLLIGKSAKEAEKANADKGILMRFGKLLDKMSNGFGNLSQKAMDKADTIRISHVRDSVRKELDALKEIKTGRAKSDSARER
ncbi:MAG: hypothetical protein K6F76_03405 [Clostridiales bacterium]|nr:hypothetical protein [Clostridiales bacterium]